MPKKENPADIVEIADKRERVLFDEIIEVVDEEPHSAALNMAVDEALLMEARAPAVRIYQWRRPAVSFGYFGKFNEVEVAWPSREPVRRWTGGGVVLHGDDLTYSLFVPKDCALGAARAADSYAAIHEVVAQWMRDRGLAVSLTAGAAKHSAECFANPVAHDIVLDGQKVSGAAQRRTRAGLLHQGSIQPAPVGLPENFSSLAEAFAARVTRRPLLARELATAEALVAGKYGTREWLTRW